MALPPVVITGLGVICAIGRDPEEFWHRLTSGEGGIRLIEDPAFANFEGRYAGQVPDEWILTQLVGDEDGLDRTAQLAMVAARQALRRAGLKVPDAGTDRFGVVLGKCQATPDAASK